MTKIEQAAVARIREIGKQLSCKGPTYDFATGTVTPGDDPAILEDPNYRKGFLAAVENYDRYLEFLATADAKALKRFCGKAVQRAQA